MSDEDRNALLATGPWIGTRKHADYPDVAIAYVDSDEEGEICVLYGDEPELTARALLIAAAPALLAAAQEALKDLSVIERKRLTLHSATLLRAAIAKARGTE